MSNIKLRKAQNISKSIDDLIFNIIIVGLLTCIFIIVAYPLYFIVIASFSDPIFVTTGKVWLYPKGITSIAYQMTFERSDLLTGYRNTFIYTICGTTIGILITMMAAFPLSYHRRLPGKKGIIIFFLITMLFSGGLVPTYLWIRSLGMLNNPLIVILLGSFSVFNLIITISFLTVTIPKELYDAAEIDGMNYLHMFTIIVLPLSKAIIAVLVIYIAVYHWNSYFNALIYLSNPKYTTLSLVLRNLLSSAMVDSSMMHDEKTISDAFKLSEQIKYAIIIVSSLPIICLYPFVQKYFVQGVMIGAIKG